MSTTTKKQIKQWGTATAVVFTALILFAISYYPYSVAQKMANSFEQPFVFHGYLQYPEDMDSYRTFCAQSERGRWLFIHPAFGEKQKGAYFNLLWLLCGKLQKVFGFDFAQTIQLLRLAAFLLLSAGIYLLLRVSGFKRIYSIVGTLLAFAVSGLGWASMLPNEIPSSLAEQPQLVQILYKLYFSIGVLFKHLIPTKLSIVPPDLYTEIATFVQGAWVPHVGISVGLLLLSAYFLLKFATKGQHKADIYIACALAVAATLIRPYEGLAFVGIYLIVALPIWWQNRKSNNKQAAIILLPLLSVLLILVYYGWLFRFHALWRTWGSGNRYSAPPFGVFDVAFFWTFWTSVAWATYLIIKRVFSKPTKKRADMQDSTRIARKALLLWAFWQFVLLYAGLSFAWRTAAALGGILSVVFAAAIMLLWQKASNKLSKWSKPIVGVLALTLVVFIVSPSNVHSYFEKIQIGERFNRYYFIEKVVDDAMRWAGENLTKGAVILTHGHYGLKLPAYGDLRPLLWHKDLTPNFKTRKSDYYAFGNTDVAEHRERVLGYYGVDFVFWGPLDKKWSRYPSLANLPFLEKIYDNGFVEIYRVIKSKIRYTSLPAHLR